MKKPTNVSDTTNHHGQLDVELFQIDILIVLVHATLDISRTIMDQVEAF